MHEQNGEIKPVENMVFQITMICKLEYLCDLIFKASRWKNKYLTHTICYSTSRSLGRTIASDWKLCRSRFLLRSPANSSTQPAVTAKIHLLVCRSVTSFDHVYDSWSREGENWILFPDRWFHVWLGALHLVYTLKCYDEIQFNPFVMNSQSLIHSSSLIALQILGLPVSFAVIL